MKAESAREQGEQRTVDLGELLAVVPPLHHVFVGASAEGEGDVAAESAAEALGGCAAAALDVELVGAGIHAGGGAEGALGQEDGHAGLAVLGVVGGGGLVEVAGGGEDVVALVVVAGEALLALQEALVDGEDGWVVLAGVVDVLDVAERGVGVEQVV